MKKFGIWSLVSIFMAMLIVSGCAKAQPPAPTTMPPLNPPGKEAAMIEISYDELLNQKNVTKSVEVTPPQSIIVSLGSNATTGYAWTENAKITDTSVVKQATHAYVDPQQSTTPVAGAAGKQVWTFDSLKAGTTTISMSYDRSWEGGEKGEWTFTLNVAVK